MSRAINVDASEAHVLDMCAKHNASISAIEKLHSGGTRVVMKNMDDAVVIIKAFGAKVITGDVLRTPSRLMHN